MVVVAWVVVMCGFPFSFFSFFFFFPKRVIYFLFRSTGTFGDGGFGCEWRWGMEAGRTWEHKAG